MTITFVDQAVAARLEVVQAWRAVYYAQVHAQHLGEQASAHLMVAGAPVIYAGAGAPVNRAIGVGMQGPVTAGDIDEIEAFYRQRRADTVIDLCPLADPSLLRLLAGRGYYVRSWMSMLVMPLPAPGVESAPSPPSGLRVTRATPEQADLWLATSARGFDESDDVNEATRRILLSNFYAANAHCYFAWQGDTPIATGGMYPHAGVVELGGASTLVAYRQQGAQTALIQRRLQDAHAYGCDLAAVLTSPGSASQRNMQRRGFQLAYTRAICVRPLAG